MLPAVAFGTVYELRSEPRTLVLTVSNVNLRRYVHQGLLRLRRLVTVILGALEIVYECIGLCCEKPSVCVCVGVSVCSQGDSRTR